MQHASRDDRRIGEKNGVGYIHASLDVRRAENKMEHANRDVRRIGEKMEYGKYMQVVILETDRRRKMEYWYVDASRDVGQIGDKWNASTS